METMARWQQNLRSLPRCGFLCLRYLLNSNVRRSWPRYEYVTPQGTVEYSAVLLSLLHVCSVCELVRMTVCMVTHTARVWINRVKLPILHVVS